MKSPSARRTGPVRQRYQPAAGGEFRQAGWSDLVAAATAPLGGSRLLFPRRLADAVAAQMQGGRAIVPSPHARWFFGDRLVFWTDPARLTTRLYDKVHDGRMGIRLAQRFVDAGDWRDVTGPVADLPEHKDMLALVEFGARYPKMPAFKQMVRGARRNRPVRRYRAFLDTEEKVHAYFRYFLALTENIRTHGFRLQTGLDDVAPASGVEVRGKFASRQRNIGVAIGPNGRLLRFLGGRHRVAIAQALGLPAVPVEIRLVHVDWLDAEIRRSGLPPAEALCEWAKSASTPGAPEPDAPRDRKPALAAHFGR